MSNPQPGWYDDAADPTMIRWWDGTSWTSHVQPRPGAPAPVARPAVVAQPDTAPRPEYAPQQDDAPRPEYAAQPGFAPQPDYATQQGYAPQPDYAAQQGYAPQPEYAAQPAATQTATYDPAPAAYAPQPAAFTPEPAAFTPEPAAFTPEPAAYTPEPAPDAFTPDAAPHAFTPDPAPAGFTPERVPDAFTPEPAPSPSPAPAPAPVSFTPDPAPSAPQQPGFAPDPSFTSSSPTVQTMIDSMRGQPAAAAPGSPFDDRHAARTDEDEPEGGGRRRRLLLIGVAIALVAVIAAGLYTTRSSDGDTGGSVGTSDSTPERAPSNKNVQVFEGDGFSVEVPKTWENTSEDAATKGTLVRFTSPDDVSFEVARTETEATLPEGADPAQVQQVALDLVVRTILEQNPDMRLLSRAPIEIDGQPAGQVTLEGFVGDDVQRSVLDGIVRDGQMWFLGISGPPDAVFAQLSTFETIAASFRFE